jgi:hypothetical protein
LKIYSRTSHCANTGRKEGKTIPTEAWTGPEGSRKLRLPEFLDNRHMKAVSLSALRTGHLYAPPPQRKDSWHPFLLEAESTPGPQCGRKDYVNEQEAKRQMIFVSDTMWPQQQRNNYAVLPVTQHLLDQQSIMHARFCTSVYQTLFPRKYPAYENVYRRGERNSITATLCSRTFTYKKII